MQRSLHVFLPVLCLVVFVRAEMTVGLDRPDNSSSRRHRNDSSHQDLSSKPSAAQSRSAALQDARDCDGELWVVSTRSLACVSCSPAEDFSPEVYRVNCEDWHVANLHALLADSDPSIQTVLYVHGNRIEPDEATERAWNVFRSLQDCYGERSRVRLVFWSWPSDRVPGLLRDVLAKADRANCEAYYLAQFLSRQVDGPPVHLVGFSFGARIVAGALHLLAGGSVSGYVMPAPVSDLPLQATLLAPAIDSHSLTPYGGFHLVLSQAERVRIVYNSQDPVLKRYWMMDRRERPRAMGYVGWEGDWDSRVEQTDVACEVGHSHWERDYFDSPTVLKLLAEANLNSPPAP